jgi:hypothetical protein
MIYENGSVHSNNQDDSIINKNEELIVATESVCVKSLAQNMLHSLQLSNTRGRTLPGSVALPGMSFRKIQRTDETIQKDVNVSSSSSSLVSECPDDLLINLLGIRNENEEKQEENYVVDSPGGDEPEIESGMFAFVINSFLNNLCCFFMNMILQLVNSKSIMHTNPFPFPSPT